MIKKYSKMITLIIFYIMVLWIVSLPNLVVLFVYENLTLYYFLIVFYSVPMLSYLSGILKEIEENHL